MTYQTAQGILRFAQLRCMRHAAHKQAQSNCACITKAQGRPSLAGIAETRTRTADQKQCPKQQMVANRPDCLPLKSARDDARLRVLCRTHIREHDSASTGLYQHFFISGSFIYISPPTYRHNGNGIR